MTQEEVYKKLNIPFGNHFAFRKDEVFVDSRGVLLVYDFEYCDWIHSRYESLQTEYVLANSECVSLMDELDWHLDGDEPKEAKDRYFAAMQDCERCEKHRAAQCIQHMQWYLTRPAAWLNTSDQEYVHGLMQKGYLSESKLLEIIKGIDYEQLNPNGEWFTLYAAHNTALQMRRQTNGNLDVQIVHGDDAYTVSIKECTRLSYDSINVILLTWNTLNYFAITGVWVNLIKGGNN